MQQVSSKLKWGGLFAAILAMFVMAFSLFTATPAQAADDLTAGNANMTAQADTTMTWPFTVYVQNGDDGERVKLKAYTEDEFKALQSSGDPISVIAKAKGSWKVFTAIDYVTLDALLTDSGADKYWKNGSYFSATNSVEGFNPEKSKHYTFELYGSQDLYYYPDSSSAGIDNTTEVVVPNIFATVLASDAIGADEKASDVEKRNVETASAKDYKSDDAVRVLVGLDSATTSDNGGNRLWSNANELTLVYTEAEVGSDSMFRMYNPNSGEHFYTSNSIEKNNLVSAGWTYEAIGWIAPEFSLTPVYRLYNPNAGDHHYTTSVAELTNLVRVGWNYEGIGWYSDDNEGTKVFRAYNPNAVAGAHNYTTNESEQKNLIAAGWKDEGTAFFGLAAA